MNDRRDAYRKSIVITTDDQGNFLLEGKWPDYTMISHKFIASSCQDILWKKGKLVFFRLFNSEAVYEMVGKSQENSDLELIKLQRLEI